MEKLVRAGEAAQLVHFKRRTRVFELRVKSAQPVYPSSPPKSITLGAAIGIAAHNLATYNPDYEIGKNRISCTVTVKHVK